jgi:hypothetical protein
MTLKQKKHIDSISILAHFASELSAIDPINLGRTLVWDDTDIPYKAAQAIIYHENMLHDNNEETTRE